VILVELILGFSTGAGFSYFLFYFGVAVWMLFDSRNRQYSGLPWIIATLFLGPLVVPAYLSKRKLKSGEIRAGGLSWNIAKYFALCWTATLAVIVLPYIVYIMYAITVDSSVPSESDKEVAGVGIFLFAIIYFIIWLIPVAVAVTTGFLLKKPNIIEVGPIDAMSQRGASQQLNVWSISRRALLRILGLMQKKASNSFHNNINP
jgi:hypothetical protein